MLTEALQRDAESRKQHQKMYSMPEYVLKYGSLMTSTTPINEEQYSHLVELVGTTPMEAKQCYFNSQLVCLAQQLRRLSPPRIRYFEGYVSRSERFHALHAWLLLDGTQLIDLTLSQRPDMVARFFGGVPPQADLKDRVLGAIPKGWEYYGCEFDAQVVALEFLERMESYSVIDDYKKGYPLLKKSIDL